MAHRTIDLSRVATLSRVVNLDSVCWREIACKRFIEQSLMPEETVLSGGFSASSLRDTEDNQVVVIVEFAFSADTNSDEKQRIAEIKAKLSLRYSIATGSVKDFDQDLVQDFAETNGVYNAWPYWRELIQSTASRIGLHGIVLPVFRIASNAEEPKEAADSQAAQVETKE